MQHNLNFYRGICTEVEDIIIQSPCIRMVFSITSVCKSICEYLNMYSLDNFKKAIIVQPAKAKPLAIYHITQKLQEGSLLNLRGSMFHIINDQRLLFSHYVVNCQLVCYKQRKLVHFAYNWKAHNVYPPPIEVTRGDNYYSKTNWLPSINLKKYTDRSK